MISALQSYAFSHPFQRIYSFNCFKDTLLLLKVTWDNELNIKLIQRDEEKNLISKKSAFAYETGFFKEAFCYQTTVSLLAWDVETIESRPRSPKN